jgi:hypothetical protein
MIITEELFGESPSQRLFQLLLGSQLVAVSTFLLSAVNGTGMKSSIAFSADHLVTVILSGKDLESRLDDTSSESKNEVEGRLLLDVVVRKSSTVLELLASKDQSLLIRGDSFDNYNFGQDNVEKENLRG